MACTALVERNDHFVNPKSRANAALGHRIDADDSCPEHLEPQCRETYGTQPERLV